MTRVARDKTRRLGWLAGMLLLGGSLAAPPTSSATPQNACLGHLSIGAAPGAAVNLQAGESAVAFTFACAFPVTGFSVVVNNEIDGFDVALPVYDRSNTLVPSESFACEGDTPGFGVNCDGSYTGAYHLVRGTLLTTGGPCATPRLTGRLIVAFASVNSKGVISQSLAGPFELGRPHGCPAVRRSGHKKRVRTKKHG